VRHRAPRLARWVRAVVAVIAVCLALALYSMWPNSYPPYPAPTAHRGGGAGSLPWLHSDGSEIVDSLGRQVLLRGMNVTGLLQARDIDPGPPLRAEDLERMRADGFDVIRLPISWSRLEPSPGRFSATYLAEIRSTVDLGARYGVYTVVDMHDIDWSYVFGGDGAPAWAALTWLPRSGPGPPPWNRHLAPAVIASYGEFWITTGWQDDVIRAWSAVARELVGDSAVAGYDLWNEPHPWPVPLGMFGHKFLLPFEARLIAALARIDEGHVWFTEQTLGAGLPTYEGRLPYPNQAFESHIFSTLLEAPWAKKVPEYRRPLDVLRANARIANGAPWVGEIGAGRGTADESWLEREMGELDAGRLGWAYWDWDERGPWNFQHESRLVPFVVRAYPRAVPGRLTLLSYDPARGALEVRFMGEACDRSLEVAVPSHWRGWRVTTSDPAASVRTSFDEGARLLRIRIDDADLVHDVRVQLSA
jgi:endoglycosylceramidase